IFLCLTLLSILPFISSLSCLNNSTVSNSIYSNGMLIKETAAKYDLGVVDCGANLNRCVAFKTMDIAFFNTLDAAKDNSMFAKLIRGNNGKVAGRCCMSEADATKIQAIAAETCTGYMSTSCSCTTDQCTGGSSMSLSLIGFLAILAYSITKN
ncbi:hypothetical protein PFISCL1PPCAC_5661, partial [Pristionchus fissidentatus]